MRQAASKHSQRGITLFVGLIMLVLITLMVTSAFTLSTTNLKSVGNMQAKDEAIAAANHAIEELLSTSFTDAPGASKIDIDINNDGTNDYLVEIATPTCVRASPDNLPAVTSGTLPSLSVITNYNTVWDIQATVNNANTGAKTVVQAGMRVLLSQAQKDTVCKDPI